MTTKLLLRTVALTCALLLSLTLQAQEFQPYYVSTVYNPTGIVDPNVKFLNSSSFQEFDQTIMREQVRKTAAKAEGQMYTITLNLEYDANVFQAPFFAYFTDDSNLIGYAMQSGEKILQGQVPSGMCNLIVQFLSLDGSQQYYFIKENVEVTGDLTFTVNPAEATNHITTKIYGPDGNLLNVGLAQYDEMTGTYIEDEPGDVYYIKTANNLHQKGLGNIYSVVNAIMGYAPEEMRNYPVDFYVTDVSDRFAFIHQRIAYTQDLSKSYCILLSTDNLQTCVLENNPNEFVQQVYNYKYTPYGRDHDDGICIMTNSWMISEKPVYCAYYSTGISLRMAKEGDCFAHELWINCPDIDPNIPDMSYFVQTRFPDYGELVTFTIDDWVIENFTPTAWAFGTPIRVKNGQKEFVNFGHIAHGENWIENNLYLANCNNEFIHKLLPAPEAFTYPAEQVLGDFGDNCPINAVNVTTYENNDQMSTAWTSYYVGRYGEVLYADMGSTTTLKYNGEEVDLSTFSPSGKGTWEVNITNPNVEVDGLPGHNTTTVFFDQNQEDMTPPAVEMLHFKNAEGGVTDRFATAEEGTMEFYASDFHYHYYPERWRGVFDCQPVEVLVEYAPYGTEDWNELAVEEIPEYYQEPGWGYFYRGSLAEVTGQGLNGWFDLRFRLQDASGNWMDQVVSPAFRIDYYAYSSVATISSGNAREVARYNLAGQRVDADATGVVIIKMSDGTARKVLK